MIGFIIGCLLGLLTYVLVIFVYDIISEIRFSRRLKEIDKEHKQIKSNINKIKNNFK